MVSGMDAANIEDLAITAEASWREVNPTKESYMKPKRICKGVQGFMRTSVQVIGSSAPMQKRPARASAALVAPAASSSGQALPLDPVTAGLAAPSQQSQQTSFSVGMQPYQPQMQGGPGPPGLARQTSTASQVAAAVSRTAASSSGLPPLGMGPLAGMSQIPPLPTPPPLDPEEQKAAISRMDTYVKEKEMQLHGNRMATLKAHAKKGEALMRLNTYVEKVDEAYRRESFALSKAPQAAGGGGGAVKAATSVVQARSIAEPLPLDPKIRKRWSDTIRSLQTLIANPCTGSECKKRHAPPRCSEVDQVVRQMKDKFMKPALSKLYAGQKLPMDDNPAPVKPVAAKTGESKGGQTAMHDDQEGASMAAAPSSSSSSSSASSSSGAHLAETNLERRLRFLREAGELVEGRSRGRPKCSTSMTQTYSKIVRHFFLCMDKDCPLQCRVVLAALRREYQTVIVSKCQAKLHLNDAAFKDMLQHCDIVHRTAMAQHVAIHTGRVPQASMADAQRGLMSVLRRMLRYQYRAKYYEKEIEICRQEHRNALVSFREPMSRDKAYSASEKRAIMFQSLDPQISLLHTATFEELRAHMYSLRVDFNAAFTPKDIQDRCSGVLSRLLAKDKAHNFFSARVNAKELGLLDYHEIVKRPMDLGYIRRRLEGKRYRSLKGFSDDVRQVWYNAILYNPPGSEVALIAEEFALYFDEMMKQVFATAEREHSEILMRDMHESKQRLEAERLQGRREQQLLREKGQLVKPGEQAQFTNNVCFLCAGQKFVFEPAMLYCTLCRKRIQRNSTFYRNEENNAHYCTHCYGTKVPADPTEDTTIVPRKLLKKAKHEETAEEEWVMCGVCDKWMHNVCGMFNRMHNELQSQTLVCPKCLLGEMHRRRSRDPISNSKSLRARDLPQYRLGNRIEKAVHKLVLRRQIESLIGASPDSAAGSSLEEALKNPKPKLLREASHAYPIPKVRIRVVSDSWQTTKVPPGVRTRYASHHPNKDYRHRSRAFALFQELDGADVLVFTMYVQEYWDDCPGPNRRSAYLSYLDSVRYFDPPELRTLVFQEVILEYLRDLKSRGFLQLILWACPPLKGDDYIFFCHPPDQQNPKPDRLRKWYQDMFDSAQDLGVVDKVVYLADDFFPTKAGSEGGRQRSMLDLPLYNGDYWPGEAETGAQELATSANVVQSSIFKGKKWLWHEHLFTDPDAAPLDLDPLMSPRLQALPGPAAAEALGASTPSPSQATASSGDAGLVPFHRQDKKQHASLWWVAASRRRASASAQADMESDDGGSASSVSADRSQLEMSQTKSMGGAVALMIGSDDEDDDDELGGAGGARGSSSKKSSKKGKVKGKKVRAKRKGRTQTARARRQSAERGSTAGDDGDSHSGGSKAHTTKGRMINATSSHLVDDPLATRVADALVNLRQDFFVAKLWPSCQLCKSFIVSGNQWYSPEHAEQGETVNVCDACYQVERTKREGAGGRLCSDAFVKQLQKRPALTGESELAVLDELKAEAAASGQQVATEETSAAARARAPAKSASVAMIDAGADDPGTKASKRSLRKHLPKSPASGAGGPGDGSAQEYKELADLFRGRLRHDDDPLVSCEFWETRENFLELCQGNHYQFDQLRRAKHSTLMVLYHMRNPKMPSFVHVCNSCNQKILKGRRWVCAECAEFDLCDECYDKTQRGLLPKHQHPLRPIAVSFTQRDREASEMEELKPLLAALEVVCGVPVSPADQALATKERIEAVQRMLHTRGAGAAGAAGGAASSSTDDAEKFRRLVQLHSKRCQAGSGRCGVPECDRFRAAAARPRLDARAAAAAERSREAAQEAQLRQSHMQHQQQLVHAAHGAGGGHAGAAAASTSSYPPSQTSSASSGRHRSSSSSRWIRFEHPSVLERRMVEEERQPSAPVQVMMSSSPQYLQIKVNQNARDKFRASLATSAVRDWARTKKGVKPTREDPPPVIEQKQAVSFDYYCTTEMHGPSLMVALMVRLLPEYAAGCHDAHKPPPVNLHQQLLVRAKAKVYQEYQKIVTASRTREHRPHQSHRQPIRAVGGPAAVVGPGAAGGGGVAQDPAISLARSLVQMVGSAAGGAVGTAGVKRGRPGEAVVPQAVGSSGGAAPPAVGAAYAGGPGDPTKRARHG